MPHTLTNMFRCLKELAISRRTFTMSSGESWFKLLVLRKIITFLKDKNERKACAHHNTFCIL